MILNSHFKIDENLPPLNSGDIPSEWKDDKLLVDAFATASQWIISGTLNRVADKTRIFPRYIEEKKKFLLIDLQNLIMHELGESFRWLIHLNMSDNGVFRWARVISAEYVFARSTSEIDGLPDRVFEKCDSEETALKFLDSVRISEKTRKGVIDTFNCFDSACKFANAKDPFFSGWYKNAAIITICDHCEGKGKLLCPECGGERGWTIVCSGCDGEKIITCPRCGGDGRFDCSTCNGTGRILFYDNQSERLVDQYCYHCSGKGYCDCRKCGGRGEIVCTACNGTGYEYMQCKKCLGKGELICLDCEGKGAWGTMFSDKILMKTSAMDFIEKDIEAFNGKLKEIAMATSGEADNNYLEKYECFDFHDNELSGVIISLRSYPWAKIACKFNELTTNVVVVPEICFGLDNFLKEILESCKKSFCERINKNQEEALKVLSQINCMSQGSFGSMRNVFKKAAAKVWERDIFAWNFKIFAILLAICCLFPVVFSDSLGNFCLDIIGFFTKSFNDAMPDQKIWPFHSRLGKIGSYSIDNFFASWIIAFLAVLVVRQWRIHYFFKKRFLEYVINSSQKEDAFMKEKENLIYNSYSRLQVFLYNVIMSICLAIVIVYFNL